MGIKFIWSEIAFDRDRNVIVVKDRDGNLVGGLNEFTIVDQHHDVWLLVPATWKWTPMNSNDILSLVFGSSWFVTKKAIVLDGDISQEVVRNLLS